jgi:hypothetical protein
MPADPSSGRKNQKSRPSGGFAAYPVFGHQVNEKVA